MQRGGSLSDRGAGRRDHRQKLAAKEVSVASWLMPGEPQVGARLSVVGFGKTRKDGARGSKVKLALKTQERWVFGSGFMPKGGSCAGH